MSADTIYAITVNDPQHLNLIAQAVRLAEMTGASRDEALKRLLVLGAQTVLAMVEAHRAAALGGRSGGFER